MDLPSWMRKRRTSVDVDSRREETPKAAKRVLKEAKDAAGGKGAKVTAVLFQLVAILTRLCSQNSRDLAEITGAVLSTYLIPEEHTLAQAAAEAGSEFNTWRKEGKKEKEESGSEEDDKRATAGHQEDLPLPHIHVAVSCLDAILQEKGGTQKAQEARKQIKDWCENNVTGKDENEIAALIKVWRVRKPQKQSKTKGINGQYAKFVLASPEGLEKSLKTYLMETGAVQKFGRAPRGYLEREANRLLQAMQKEEL